MHEHSPGDGSEEITNAYNRLSDELGQPTEGVSKWAARSLLKYAEWESEEVDS